MLGFRRVSFETIFSRMLILLGFFECWVRPRFNAFYDDQMLNVGNDGLAFV